MYIYNAVYNMHLNFYTCIVSITYRTILHMEILLSLSFLFSNADFVKKFVNVKPHPAITIESFFFSLLISTHIILSISTEFNYSDSFELPTTLQ